MFCELNKVITVEGLSELSWNNTMPMISTCAPKHSPLANKKFLRSIAEQVLPQNKWKRSLNPAEKYASQAVIDLGFNDKHETKLLESLNRNPDFKLLRQQNRPLSNLEEKCIASMIAVIRGGIVVKEPETEAVKSLLIPIGKQFFQDSNHKNVAVSLFVTRLQEYIDIHKIENLKPVADRSSRNLADILKSVLPNGCYRNSRSGKDAEELIKRFLMHHLPNMSR
ncbi:hypothetical protein [Vibrio natriegens]|uniref:hypothetical protein n=1 Tax=Vibrio natriegens TaxID=691 RepID=UPI00390C2484